MKQRNKFDLSASRGLPFDMGELVPVGIWEVVPGDSFDHSTFAMTRMQALNAPVFQTMHQHVHHYFVPSRILWDEFEDFITGGIDGTAAPTYPTITVNTGSGWAVQSLADHLRFPVGVDDISCDALIFRAMAMIWNECYRDNSLQTPLVIDLTSGPDTTTNTTLQHVCWEKDYFTSSRPWEQLGTEVTIPLVGTAPVISDGTAASLIYTGLAGARTINAQGSNQMAYSGGSGTGTSGVWSNTGMEVDGSNFAAPSVNELRFAMAWERVLENRARYGSRYVELLRAWGVRSSDARLQRPEYLGGGRNTIQVSEVLQTAMTTSGGSTGIGDLYGHGLGSVKARPYRKFFEEFGYVISVMFVRPKTSYSQGIPRMYNRRTREDFFQPELVHLGQQDVLKQEIYAQGTAVDLEKWGNQDRYDELRRSESSVTGKFRPGQNLDDWTQTRVFGSLPTLNSDFVKCDPTKDIFQYPTEPGLLSFVYHNCRARRQLPKVGTSFIR